VRESRALPRSYFQGLNFLLNAQPDRAIEAFVEAVKVDPQTIELHFALGSLFRRRGETDRAIRMHQNLIEREDLKQELKLQALAELGQDYLKAGLLDRAEAVFDKLRDSELGEDAKRNLLEIYQLEKHWEKAIAIASELPDFASHKEIAEYYCELAAAEMIRSRRDLAAGYLQTALERNRKCVRASLLQGDMRCRRSSGRRRSSPGSGSSSRIRRIWRWWRSACSTLSASSTGGMPACACCAAISNATRRSICSTSSSSWCSRAMARGRLRLVRDELKRNPTLLGFDKLLEARLLFASAGDSPRPGAGERDRADLHASSGALSVR
jgi:tetratricopeptide (TPR) repeat protein